MSIFRKMNSILSGVAFCLVFASASPAASPPNLILVTVDTLRADYLGCYGAERPATPFIDALAGSGVLFLRAFAHNPLTLPSHANLMLGTTPLVHGVHENTLAKVAGDNLTLAEFLKERGYATAAFIGAFSLDSRFGLAQGFDVYDERYPSRPGGLNELPERPAAEVVRAALGWLERARAPWFAWIHLWDPHAPYLPPADFLKLHPDNPYAGEVAYADSELGKLLNFLEANRLRSDTLVVLTSDHGEAFGEHGETRHGYFAYNTTLWVPLLAAGPGLPGGRRVKQNVSHIDVFPSICEWMGFEPPRGLQGRSLKPLIAGKKWDDRPLYFESLEPYLHYGWAPLRGFLEGENKFLDGPIPEYYHLGRDFSESRNQAASIPLEDFRRRLNRLMERLSAPRSRPDRISLDRGAREKLRSLGYLSAPLAKGGGGEFRPEDDLKSLLPVQQMLSDAARRFEDGETEPSLRIFREVIQSRPDFAKAYVLMARALAAAGRPEDALGVLGEGHAANPGDYEISAALGIQLVRSGRLDEGRRILEGALEVLDTDPDVWNHLGVAFSQAGIEERALECFRKALELDRSDALIHNNLGVHYLTRFMRSGDRENRGKAAEAFKTAIESDPTLVSAYNGLASAYRAAGRREAATELWEKAVALDPEYAMPYYNLGRAYIEARDFQRALGALEKYRTLRAGRMSPEEEREIADLIQRCRKR